MTRPHQHELDETAQDARNHSTAAGIVRRAISTANRIPAVEGGPPVPAEVAGGITAVNGALGVREGVAGYQAAAGREQAAREHGDSRGVQYAHEDEINAGFTGARGATTFGNGVASTAQALLGRGGGVGSGLSRVGGGLQVLQGLHQGVQGVRNWNRDPERSSREVSDGILNLAGGGLSLSGGPLATAGAAGIGLGNAARNSADNHARESGILGVGRAGERGFHVGRPRAPEGMTATDAAADLGVRVNERLGGGVLGNVAGGVTTIAAAPLAVGATFAHGAITTGSRHAGHVDMSDIAAQQAEDHGAPLAANDHSAVAAHRRRIQHRHTQRAQAQAQAGQQHREQIARDGHVDMMAPERAAPNAQFTPINGSNAQSIERRALGMGPSREEFEAGLMRAIQ